MPDRCARCDFTGDLHQHDADTGHPVCFVCQRRSLTVHERQTCAHCVARTRADLADIENLYSRLPGVLVENRIPNSGANDRTGGTHEPLMPGGDALAMLAPGGAGYDNSSRRGNRDHVADELTSDPPSVPGLLAVHEDDWRHQLGHPAAGPPTVSGSVAYLTSQLDRMAQVYSEFDTFTVDMRTLRSRLQVVAGLSERPVVGADCFDCGQRLVRRYRYQGDRLKPAYSSTSGPGLEDDWTCERCERVYTPAEYFLAVRAQLESARDVG